MSRKSALLRFYKQNAILRYVLQFVLIAVIYLALREWQARDFVKGDAPEIRATLMSGEAVSLHQLQTPVLVHFWASWCPICKFEFDSIQSLSRDYTVITIASWSGAEQEVKDFMEKQGLDFPVIVDEDGEWARFYGVNGVPASFFINKHHQVWAIEKGYTTETGMRLRMWWLENR